MALDSASEHPGRSILRALARFPPGSWGRWKSRRSRNDPVRLWGSANSQEKEKEKVVLLGPFAWRLGRGPHAHWRYVRIVNAGFGAYLWRGLPVSWPLPERRPISCLGLQKSSVLEPYPGVGVERYGPVLSVQPSLISGFDYAKVLQASVHWIRRAWLIRVRSRIKQQVCPESCYERSPDAV